MSDESDESVDNQNDERDRLRGRVRSGIRGIILSVLLMVWVVWVLSDWGMSIFIVAFAAFAFFALSVFIVQTTRPALKLRRMGESVL